MLRWQTPSIQNAVFYDKTLKNISGAVVKMKFIEDIFTL